VDRGYSSLEPEIRTIDWAAVRPFIEISDISNQAHTKISHKIFGYRSSEEHKNARLKFISYEIGLKVVNLMVEQAFIQLAAWFTRNASYNFSKSFLGDLFEPCAHRLLCLSSGKQQSFLLRKLEQQSYTEQHRGFFISSPSPVRFRSIESIATVDPGLQCNIYYQPFSKVWAALDAFLLQKNHDGKIDCYGFQMTVSAAKTLDLSNLQSHIDDLRRHPIQNCLLRNFYLVLVVDPHTYDGFKTEKPAYVQELPVKGSGRSKAERLAAADNARGLINAQYVLRLPLDSLATAPAHVVPEPLAARQQRHPSADDAITYASWRLLTVSCIFYCYCQCSL